MEKLTNILWHLAPLSLVVASFILTYLAIPKIVKFAKRKKLFDIPDSRKEHTTPIPALGGISIMIGMVPALMFLAITIPCLETLVFISGLVILFVTGVIDDIILFSAMKRLIIQLVVATCIVLSGVRFPHLFGMFGSQEVSDVLLIPLNIIIITGIINAFNLIDGINGLAGGLGCISIFILGMIFTITGQTAYALIAFSAAISYLAFLRYNLKPTFIFMGDNGSLVLGYLIAFFSLKLLQRMPLNNFSETYTIFKIIIAICTIPVMDAIRVFAGRMLKGKSPFSPDKTHIHHLLVRRGFTHHRSSIVLYSVHVILITLSMVYFPFRIEYLLLINLTVFAGLVVWLNAGTISDTSINKKASLNPIPSK